MGVPKSSAQLATESRKTELEESQVRCHECSLQQMDPAGNILPTPAAVTVDGIVTTLPAGGATNVGMVSAAVMLNCTVAVRGRFAGGGEQGLLAISHGGQGPHI